jgi:hypothetical protein
LVSEVHRKSSAIRHGEAGPGKTRTQLLRVAPRDFVMQQHREELGVGELAVNGFAVALLERIQDA